MVNPKPLNPKRTEGFGQAKAGGTSEQKSGGESSTPNPEHLHGGFPKIGDPNIVPYIVGSLLYKDPKIRYPNFRKVPHTREDT